MSKKRFLLDLYCNARSFWVNIFRFCQNKWLSSTDSSLIALICVFWERLYDTIAKSLYRFIPNSVAHDIMGKQYFRIDEKLLTF